MSKRLIKCGPDSLKVYDDYTYQYDSHVKARTYSNWKIEAGGVYVNHTVSVNWIFIDQEHVFTEIVKEADDIIKFDKEVEEFLSDD